jgi:putative colanic acid biosynthesis acetyltransferase WcaF
MKLAGYKSRYNHEKSVSIQFLWYVVSLLVFESAWFPLYEFKIRLLKTFGARIGKGLVLKPKVYIKYPWMLEVGSDVWIGEGVRIDNLAKVKIGSDVCISQNAFLLTGNHDYRSVTFDLMIGSITIEDEVWVGASVVVCPNTILSKGTVVSVGSVISGTTIGNQVYRGNPALVIRPRYKEA